MQLERILPGETEGVEEAIVLNFLFDQQILINHLKCLDGN